MNNDHKKINPAHLHELPANFIPYPLRFFKNIPKKTKPPIARRFQIFI